MATIERHGFGFRISFRFAGQRFRRTLKSQNAKEANGALARLEDNLRRVQLGLLELPDDVEVVTYLLSDGRSTNRPKRSPIRTLRQLVDNFFENLPYGSLELSTIAGMRIHQAHLERILGESFAVQSLDSGQLQGYIVARSSDAGTNGRKVSTATIAKDLRTFGSVWNFAKQAGLVSRVLPKQGLRFPKVQEKPPFQTR